MLSFTKNIFESRKNFFELQTPQPGDSSDWITKEGFKYYKYQI